MTRYNQTIRYFPIPNELSIAIKYDVFFGNIYAYNAWTIAYWKLLACSRLTFL